MRRTIPIFATTSILAASLALGQPAPAAAPAPPSPPSPVAAPAPASEIRSMVLGSRSYLGVNVKEIDSNRAKELKLREEHGVEVTQVEEDSPAGKAGKGGK